MGKRPTMHFSGKVKLGKTKAWKRIKVAEIHSGAYTISKSNHSSVFWLNTINELVKSGASAINHYSYTLLRFVHSND